MDSLRSRGLGRCPDPGQMRWQAAQHLFSLAAVDPRYPDPNGTDPEIDIALVIKIALGLRLRLLHRLGAEL